ncbi:hypothetical protein Glove_281g57 [Diversispora epigaea]|uniref:Uncharacterized protein n=1 Tax=Diversispora epigaea TaxID=1348612 RepID=A0A397I1W9_9GLOM|nr:hypothetical protein Glove_281g57 [Diversispora epigaea]
MGWDFKQFILFRQSQSFRVESADEVYELLSQEVSRLQELYVKCLPMDVGKTCLNRENNRENDRIRKKGIRPTSFFQSSFRLLEKILLASLESFEECAIQLLHYTLQDEIDKGMFCLFANKSDPT